MAVVVEVAKGMVGRIGKGCRMVGLEGVEVKVLTDVVLRGCVTVVVVVLGDVVLARLGSFFLSLKRIKSSERSGHEGPTKFLRYSQKVVIFVNIVKNSERGGQQGPSKICELCECWKNW